MRLYSSGRRIGAGIAALACAGLAAAAAAVNTSPDWSGVWMINDDTTAMAVADSAGSGEGSGIRVPLRPKYFALRATLVTEGRQGNLPTCLPAGMPGLMQHPMMTEFLFTLGRITMLFEDGEVRRIHTDGRNHPAEAEQEYGPSGHSIGRWEKQTLVIDTVGISEQSDLLMLGPVRTTRKTHVTERVYLKNADTLQIDTVVSDEELFSKPYAYTRSYERLPLAMGDPSCASTNRDTDRSVDLTPPPAASSAAK
jgi:hypothetical protein